MEKFVAKIGINLPKKSPFGDFINQGDEVPQGIPRFKELLAKGLIEKVSVDESRSMAYTLETNLSELSFMKPPQVKPLKEKGIIKIRDLSEYSVEDLTAIRGVAEKTARQLLHIFEGVNLDLGIDDGDESDADPKMNISKQEAVR